MIVARLVALVIGYVCGLFQTGYIYGKLHGIDIRTQGSGNAGTTNSLRVLGMKAGLITFLGDFLKAILAVIVVRLIYGDSYPEAVKVLELYAGFGAVIGHNFPFYLGFKGGKGIACTSGVIISVCPAAAIACAIIFFLCLGLTRYVSLGSIGLVIVFLIQMVIFDHMGYFGIAANYVWEFDLLCICFTAMAIWRHRANIVRLIHGTENKFSLKKKEK